MTGFSSFVTELSGKRVELFKEAVPSVTRVGFFSNMSNPVVPPQWQETKKKAHLLDIATELLDVRSKEDIGRAFEAISRSRVDGLLVGIDGVTQEHRELIGDLASTHALRFT